MVHPKREIMGKDSCQEEKVGRRGGVGGRPDFK